MTEKNELQQVRDALNKCYVPNGRGSNTLNMERCYNFVREHFSTLAITLLHPLAKQKLRFIRSWWS